MKAGEGVAVVEAMKMQNIIRAERDGVAVNQALLRLREAALSGENIMPPSIAAENVSPAAMAVTPDPASAGTVV